MCILSGASLGNYSSTNPDALGTRLDDEIFIILGLVMIIINISNKLFPPSNVYNFQREFGNPVGV